MKNLLTLVTICVLFVGLGYGQKKSTLHDIGKDKDGDTWYIDTDLVRQGSGNLSWVTFMAIFTPMNDRILVFYYNVDCSDSTYQFVKAQTMDAKGTLLWEKTASSRWVPFASYSGRGGRIACEHIKKGNRIPISTTEVY